MAFSAVRCGAKNSHEQVNLTKAYRNQMAGTWGFVEVAMSTLFSFAFGAIFLAFIVAVLVGHVLVIEALVRPFFGRLAVSKRPMSSQNSLAHAR